MHIHVHLSVPTPPLVAPLPEFDNIKFSTPTSAKRKRHGFAGFSVTAGPSTTAGPSNVAGPAMPLDANDADDDLPAPSSKRQKNQAKRKAEKQKKAQKQDETRRTKRNKGPASKLLRDGRKKPAPVGMSNRAWQ